MNTSISSPLVTAPAENKISDPEKPLATTPRDKTKSSMQPGETFEYKGYTVVKVDPNAVTNESESTAVVQEWRQELQDFFHHEFGEDEVLFEKYMRAQDRAFERYQATLGEIMADVKQNFGDGFDVALVGSLKELSDLSEQDYEAKLRTTLGPEGYAKFEEFKSTYLPIASARHKASAEMIK